MKKRTNYILYLVFLLIVYSILFIPFKNYIVDDTFIHIQFAKNVVNLGEFSFNAGEPTYGMTSPLWVLLIAFFHKLTSVDPVLITRSLSFSFGFLTILTLFALVLKVSKSYLVAILSALLLILDVWFLRWTSSGMETSATMFLVLFAIYYYLKEREEKKTIYISSLLCGIAVLFRPECFILFIAIIIDHGINYPQPLKQKICNLFYSLFFFLLPQIPWNIYAYFAFRTIIPNTMLAKIGHSYSWPIMRTSKILFGSYLIEILFIFSAGILTLLRDKSKTWQGIKQNLFLILWPVGLILFYILGKSDVLTRYLLLISPLIIAFGVISINYFANKFPKKARTILFGVFSIIIIFNAFVFSKINYHHIYQTSHYNIEHVYAYIGKWLNRNTKKDAVIAMGEIGAIGYYADRKILDTLGLITPEIIPYLRKSKVMEFIKLKKPDYYVGDDEIKIAFGDKAKLLFTRTYSGGRARDPKNSQVAKKVYKLHW